MISQVSRLSCFVQCAVSSQKRRNGKDDKQDSEHDIAVEEDRQKGQGVDMDVADDAAKDAQTETETDAKKKTKSAVKGKSLTITLRKPEERRPRWRL